MMRRVEEFLWGWLDGWRVGIDPTHEGSRQMDELDVSGGVAG